jgi:hypothetical protein
LGFLFPHKSKLFTGEILKNYTCPKIHFFCFQKNSRGHQQSLQGDFEFPITDNQNAKYENRLAQRIQVVIPTLPRPPSRHVHTRLAVHTHALRTCPPRTQARRPWEYAPVHYASRCPCGQAPTFFIRVRKTKKFFKNYLQNIFKLILFSTSKQNDKTKINFKNIFTKFLKYVLIKPT